MTDLNAPGLLAVAPWQVGTRYTLLKTLGAGSFSSVVAALDNDTGEKVRQQRDSQAVCSSPWLVACAVSHVCHCCCMQSTNSHNSLPAVHSANR